MERGQIDAQQNCIVSDAYVRGRGFLKILKTSELLLSSDNDASFYIVLQHQTIGF